MPALQLCFTLPIQSIAPFYHQETIGRNFGASQSFSYSIQHRVTPPGFRLFFKYNILLQLLLNPSNLRFVFFHSFFQLAGVVGDRPWRATETERTKGLSTTAHLWLRQFVPKTLRKRFVSVPTVLWAKPLFETVIPSVRLSTFQLVARRKTDRRCWISSQLLAGQISQIFFAFFRL